jgi:hypothetical protein
MRTLLAASAVLILAFYPALARDLSDLEVRAEIVKASIAAYKATGHPCACPEEALGMEAAAASEAPIRGREARRRYVIQATLRKAR